MTKKTIEVLTPCAGTRFSFGVGVHEDVDGDTADMLIKAGYAKMHRAKKAPEKTVRAKPKPETTSK